jgi:hypothetical protein
MYNDFSQRNGTKREEMDSDSNKSYMNRRKSSVYEEIDVGKVSMSYPWRAPVFTPYFWWGPCSSSF